MYSSIRANLERTFILIKPDAVQRGLIGKIIERFEVKGFKLIGMKFVWVISFSNLKWVAMSTGHKRFHWYHFNKGK